MWLRYGSILFALPGLLLLVLYGIEMSAVTDCLQQNGSYNFDNQSCSDQPQPHSTFYARNTILVNLMMLLSLIGALAMTWGMLLKGMTRPEH
ncbi:hypothetical protein [Bacterioplanoides sp. SCSIO 12839]|uniref:hypothetical protein n=1 Tax=Bacterioplanoides sp. SCSIO 12839 TaxID=2829569 RepID=UPI00210231FD|nr:hypothetical protein [Bacterioplanoides sp. SCSIO 12839]UTW47819.1 hypothetical protein KFF03_14805 [Bacterioplanoides sp. SCSIO 12839]